MNLLRWVLDAEAPQKSQNCSTLRKFAGGSGLANNQGMSRLFIAVTFAALFGAAPAPGVTVHSIRPGEDPQAALDRAAPGDRIVFLPGVHLRHLGKYRSMLYVDKSIDIELQAGAVLRLPDNETKLEKAPEITTDQGGPKKLDDFEPGGEYDLGIGPIVYSFAIDGVGTGGAPDTFKWGSGAGTSFQYEKVPITGGWQELSHGVKIRFAHPTGHSAGSVWYLSYDGPAAYGIRIGHGRQADYIENVRIFGRGTIDLNMRHNVQPSFLVKDINACILVHGRVRNVEIEGVTMTDTNRSVMLYGEHSGAFLQGGGTAPGESFDAENISITHTRTINPAGSGYLLGHPSHRGRLSKVRCNYNYMETATTAIEPNFRLDQYEVIGNVIKSGGRAIHCWRKSTNGLIKDNVRIDDPTGLEVVMVNAPGAWENPENIVIRDNRNHLSDPVGFWANASGGQDNRATGRFATVGGGSRNRALGIASTVLGGVGNSAEAEYSTARGWQARATRPGEDAQASGMFAEAGDAQSSQLVARGVTRSADPAYLALGGEAGIAMPRNGSVAYRVLVVARGEDGRAQAAFEAHGLASRSAAGELTLAGGKVTAIHASQPGLAFQVSADSQAGAVRLEAKGLPGAVIRWVARVELSEVRF
jgi:hypothetical protein